MQGFLLVPESMQHLLQNADAKQILKWFKKAGIYLPKSFFDTLKAGVYKEDSDVDEMTEQMERAIQGHTSTRNFIIIVYPLSNITNKSTYNSILTETDGQATLNHILIELASHALASKFSVEPIIQIVDLDAAMNANPVATEPPRNRYACCI